MTERINRREEMINAARQLFTRQGYIGTSIQQIADAVGCTKAALYYHFKEGKEEILQEVLHAHFPTMLKITETTEGASSLHDLITRFGYGMLGEANEIIDKLRWVIVEYPNFNVREQEMLHEKQQAVHAMLTSQVRRFVPDQAEAEKITWQMMCTFIGYSLFFIGLDLRSQIDFQVEDIVERTANLIAGGR